MESDLCCFCFRLLKMCHIKKENVGVSYLLIEFSSNFPFTLHIVVHRKSATSTGVTDGTHCNLTAGLGWGEVLDLDLGDCFGDPVNMAFKLGEDTAKAGEILVNAPFWQQVQLELKDNGIKMTYDVEERVVEMSGVKIPHFAVHYKSL